MGNFLCWFGIGLVVLPIPIGYFWVWVYRNRRSIGLPDWFSGVLAQGIISGHKISSNGADEDDYTFIIFATIISTFIVIVILYLLLWFLGFVPALLASGTSNQPSVSSAPYATATTALYVTPNTDSQNLDENVEETVQGLIHRWYDIKTEADRNISNKNLNTVLRGDFLDYQLEVITTLRNKNCYWVFANRRIRFDVFRLYNNNYATIELTVWEDADLYCNGQHDPASWTRYEPYSMRYVAEKINSTWYLTGKEVISQ